MPADRLLKFNIFCVCLNFICFIPGESGTSLFISYILQDNLTNNCVNGFVCCRLEIREIGNELQSIKGSPSQYVKLNVGGSLYYTTIGTLTKVQDTMLQAMFSGRMEVLTDSEGKTETSNSKVNCAKTGNNPSSGQTLILLKTLTNSFLRFNHKIYGKHGHGVG